MRALAALLRIVALTTDLLIIEAASAIYIFVSESIASELGLTALLRIVALTADLLIIEAASAIYIFLSESIASELGHKLAALLRIVALTADLLIIEAASAIYIFLSGSIASELGHKLTVLLLIEALTAMRFIGMITRKATDLIYVSVICTVCNTFAVIKPLRRVHLHLGLCPRRKVR